jgi:hypothetical protein
MIASPNLPSSARTPVNAATPPAIISATGQHRAAVEAPRARPAPHVSRSRSWRRSSAAAGLGSRRWVVRSAFVPSFGRRDRIPGGAGAGAVRPCGLDRGGHARCRGGTGRGVSALPLRFRGVAPRTRCVPTRHARSSASFRARPRRWIDRREGRVARLAGHRGVAQSGRAFRLGRKGPPVQIRPPRSDAVFAHSAASGRRHRTLMADVPAERCRPGVSLITRSML